MSSGTRHPRDGRPYYCAVCGLGIAEFMACEEPDCRLESNEEARRRANPHNEEATDATD